jgi:superfamily I DNA and RNA helicase
MKTDLSFWKKVQDQVTGEDITENWLFDTLIVDEGQDFRNEWSEIIRLFTKEDAGILWLEDRDQNLYQTPPVTLEGFTTYRHLVNYRSPYTIAEFIKNTLPFEFIIGNSLPGLGVKSHQYTNPEEQVEIVTSIVHDLRKAGFSNENITLLTCRGIKNSVFSGTDKIGRIKLRNFTGDYDSDGNQIHTEGELLFDSVYRFKGQQAEAIILVDIDPNPNRIQLEEQILFCGMTRATVRLEIVFKRDNSGNQRFMS